MYVQYGPSVKIWALEIDVAIVKMKQGKLAGPTGVKLITLRSLHMA